MIRSVTPITFTCIKLVASHRFKIILLVDIRWFENLCMKAYIFDLCKKTSFGKIKRALAANPHLNRLIRTPRFFFVVVLIRKEEKAGISKKFPHYSRKAHTSIWWSKINYGFSKANYSALALCTWYSSPLNNQPSPHISRSLFLW
jgi:hypothetical protein